MNTCGLLDRKAKFSYAFVYETKHPSFCRTRLPEFSCLFIDYYSNVNECYKAIPQIPRKAELRENILLACLKSSIHRHTGTYYYCHGRHQLAPDEVTYDHRAHRRFKITRHVYTQTACEHILKSIGEPGSIPALVLPSGSMAARHRKGVKAELFNNQSMLKSQEALYSCFIFIGDHQQCASHETLESLEPATSRDSLEFRSPDLCESQIYSPEALRFEPNLCLLTFPVYA
ncbi:hypothetical protein T265_09137 [Opisthorchis viverrini]|uniref:Uncharacterized protein n=1 Tax=Opisthorchis viverrini TaxID=6198 RepID=A0A075A5Z6_OPIVI|nr:hypothetical protein T265_09137 [Opisthorchis viverrini]KER22864.1 hypothetical protein T265_09137 [Opisthorchis viverrini]